LGRCLAGRGPFTLFAPTNAAFQTLFIELGVKGIDDLTKEHSPRSCSTRAGRRRTSTDLSDGLWRLPCWKATGTRVHHRQRRSGRQCYRAAHQLAATNGVVHAIDRYWRPPAA
jgi:transforming growth factor-beta-induced protein